MRLLQNVRSGIVLPYNVNLATHPDMVDYQEPKPEPKTKPKAKAPRKKAAAKQAPAKQALPVGTTADAELDDLIAGIDNG